MAAKSRKRTSPHKLKPDRIFIDGGQQRFRSGQVYSYHERLEAYRILKPRILEALLATGWSQERTLEWFNTPQYRFQGRTPKQMMSPLRIRSLWRKLKACLRAEVAKDLELSPKEAVCEN